MERIFRFKNTIGLAKIVIVPDGRVEVVYLPHDDRLAGRSVPCTDLLTALQEFFATNAEVDPFTLGNPCPVCCCLPVHGDLREEQQMSGSEP